MTEDQSHAIYRWTEYRREQWREECERRHFRAAMWGALTALVGILGIFYLVG